MLFAVRIGPYHCSRQLAHLLHDQTAIDDGGVDIRAADAIAQEILVVTGVNSGIPREISGAGYITSDGKYEKKGCHGH